LKKYLFYNRIKVWKYLNDFTNNIVIVGDGILKDAIKAMWF